MQEEVNEKTVALCVKGGKISAEILKTAMRKFLHSMEQARSEKGKKHTRAPDQKKDVVSHGKQSIKSCKKEAASSPILRLRKRTSNLLKRWQGNTGWITA